MKKINLTTFRFGGRKGIYCASCSAKTSAPTSHILKKTKNLLLEGRLYFAGFLSVLTINYASGQTITGRTINVPDNKPVQTEIKITDKISGHKDYALSDTLNNGYFSINTTNGNKILEFITNDHDIIRDTNFVVHGDTSIGTIQPQREKNTNGTTYLNSTQLELHGSSIDYLKLMHERRDTDPVHILQNWQSNRRRVYIANDIANSWTNIDTVLKTITNNKINIIYDKQSTDSTIGIRLIGVPFTDSLLNFNDLSAPYDSINSKGQVVRSKIYFANDIGTLSLFDVSFAFLSAETLVPNSPDPTHVMRENIGTASIPSSDEVNLVNDYQIFKINIDLRTYIDSIGVVDTTIVQPLPVKLFSGWNMFAVPTHEANMSKEGLFPEAISSAFKYTGGYNTVDTLQNGEGYWIKLATDETKQFIGQKIKLDTLHLKKGWNIIGGISYDVPMDSVEDLQGIIASSLFDYNGSYQIKDTVKPGEGYWLKANNDGDLVVKAPGAGSKATPRTVPRVDKSELPPAPGQTMSKIESNIGVMKEPYPNPFNPTTSIEFSISGMRFVSLRIYNVLGDEINNLVSEQLPAGTYKVTWNAVNVPSGVYFYTLKAGSFTETKKLVLLR